MNQLQLVLLVAAIFGFSEGLTLYNTTEWKEVTTFSSSPGQTYWLYKPICTGKLIVLVDSTI